MARIITLSESGGDPDAVPNQVIIYSKDVGGVATPFAVLDDSTVIDLSAGGGGGITLDDVRDAIGDTGDPLLGGETVNVNALTVGNPGGTPRIELKVNEGEVDTAELSFTLSTSISSTGNMQITSQGESSLEGPTARLRADNLDDGSSAFVYCADGGFDTGVRIRCMSDSATQASQIQVTRGNGVTIQGTTDSCMLTLENGVAAAVSPASTGRIRYNSTDQRLEVSENAGAYKAINTPFGATGYVTLDTATEKTIFTVELPSVDAGSAYGIDFNFKLPQPVGASQSVTFTVESGDENITYYSIGEGGTGAGNRHYTGRLIISFGPVVGPDQNVMRSAARVWVDSDDDSFENKVENNGPELFSTPLDKTLVVTIEISDAADTGEEQVAHATISRLS